MYAGLHPAPSWRAWARRRRRALASALPVDVSALLKVWVSGLGSGRVETVLMFPPDLSQRAVEVQQLRICRGHDCRSKRQRDACVSFFAACDAPEASQTSTSHMWTLLTRGSPREGRYISSAMHSSRPAQVWPPGDRSSPPQPPPLQPPDTLATSATALPMTPPLILAPALLHRTAEA